MKKPEFTPEQQEWICYQIDEWYLYYKDRLINYDDRTHRLGLAKEQLKILLCCTEDEKTELLRFLDNFSRDKND
jgi:hypothetical protein